jgi:ubiquinol-cytochrome c reductase iron-sulfur subunit
LAGRVFKGAPALYTLSVPPYRFLSDSIVWIGENPMRVSWRFDSIERI